MRTIKQDDKKITVNGGSLHMFRKYLGRLGINEAMKKCKILDIQKLAK